MLPWRAVLHLPITLCMRLKDKLWMTFLLSHGSWKSNSGHQLGDKHLSMPSHPAISSCTLSYWLETKSIDSTGWTRTEIHLLSLELKACPTTPRLLMHLWRLETDVPNTHFRFPSTSTLLWIHCTPNKGCSQKLPSQHQGSGLAPLPVLSTQGSRVQLPCLCGEMNIFIS